MNKMTYSVGFLAEHSLPGHPTCGETHHHDYTLEVVLSRKELNEQGMVVDYFDLKKLVQDHILSVIRKITPCKLPNLNENLPESAQPTTAENIAKWAYERLDEALDRWINVEEVTIQELPGFSATYTGKDN